MSDSVMKEECLKQHMESNATKAITVNTFHLLVVNLGPAYLACSGPGLPLIANSQFPVYEVIIESLKV